MTYHCPRCSEFVVKDAEGCTACGANFVELGWEPKHSPIDLSTPEEAPGKAAGSFLLLLFAVPIFFILIVILLIVSALFGSGSGMLWAIGIGLIGLPFLLTHFVKAGIKVFKS